MKFVEFENGFEIYETNNVILRHSNEEPMFFIGKGIHSMKMYRGNYDIKGYIDSKVPLVFEKFENDTLYFNYGFSFKLVIIENNLEIITASSNDTYNRFWCYLPSTKLEKVYGLGEQMSYLNLRGRSFPIWTSEPGVGRDKSTYITWKSNVDGMSGGDYYNSNYPEPSFISSQKYYFTLESFAYSIFDFTDSNYHKIEVWEIPNKISITIGNSYKHLLRQLKLRFERNLPLPSWVNDGIILGLQGGLEVVDSIYQKSLSAGMEISGLWCQDWEGVNHTSFGKRLNWNWQVDHQLYPNLQSTIQDYNAENTKFLGYINPYVVINQPLFEEANAQGYLALKQNGEIYTVDFGEFYCGIVDFTNENAFTWFKEIIKRELLGVGLNGWMADFGEYLPTDDDIVLNSGNPMNLHNEWPVLWAKCNYEALLEVGKLDEVLYFMRAGGYGTQKYTQLLWAGDQSVDFTLHDGLATTIIGALSSGLCGNPFSHSDIGGYTSLYGNTRNKELFLRWAEMAVFTPVMRTHEGNRPTENFQYYNDDDCIRKLARLTRIFKLLKPYTQHYIEAFNTTGLAMQLPLFIFYEGDSKSYEYCYQYMYGEDILVAPVYSEGVDEWEIYLPDDKWINIWSGEEFKPGVQTVEAPVGFTPAFYRENSIFSSLLEQVKLIK